MSEQIDGKFYQVFSTGSLSERLLIMARDRIYDHFLSLCQPLLLTLPDKKLIAIRSLALGKDVRHAPPLSC